MKITKEKTGKLIEALRKAANDVEKDKRTYDWGLPQSCNCGIVAQILMGKTARGIKSEVAKVCDKLDSDGPWTDMAKDVKKYCRVTGEPLPHVFQALIDTGFEWTDFQKLEYMKDKTILKRAGIDIKALDWNDHYEEPENFIKYCRAWADILTEKMQKEEVQEVEIAKPEVFNMMEL